jgi:hypothetical protein
MGVGGRIGKKWKKKRKEDGGFFVWTFANITENRNSTKILSLYIFHYHMQN